MYFLYVPHGQGVIAIVFVSVACQMRLHQMGFPIETGTACDDLFMLVRANYDS